MNKKLIRKATCWSVLNSCLLYLLPALAFAAPADLERVRELYQQTEYEQALRLLEASREKGPEAYELTGKAQYMLENYKKATDAFEKAVAADPTNASYVNWLGKAFGRRAETSFFLRAPSYATTARKHFERAVALDSQNLEALSDLFEYYLQAPGFLGGGRDKASELSERVRELDPVKYHHMQARLAEKRKDFAVAEQELRQAAELAPAEEGRLLDLAKFLSGQGRHRESDEIFEHAEQLAPDSPKIKFERAKTYVRANRNLDVARKLLEQYLNSPLTPDDPPRSEAQQLLNKARKG